MMIMSDKISCNFILFLMINFNFSGIESIVAPIENENSDVDCILF